MVLVLLAHFEVHLSWQDVEPCCVLECWRVREMEQVLISERRLLSSFVRESRRTLLVTTVALLLTS